MATNEELEQRINQLESALSQLKSDASVGSVFGGKFSHKYPARFQSPEGGAYILVRETGGNATFVSAPGSSSDWSDA